MACVLQWCCALFLVLIIMFSHSECRRSGGGRRISIRTRTYTSRKSKPSYHSSGSSSGSSTSKRYPGYPIHQGHGGVAAFPGGYGPGSGGFGRFGIYEPTYRYAAINTFDSSTLWLSLYSLTRDVNHYHFYYPNSSPAKNIPDKGSFSTQVGNMTCISIYNAKAVTKWATDTLNDLNKLFPKTQFPVNVNGTRKGLNFTVVPGEIIHNETLGVMCCGTAKGIVNLAVLTSGMDSDVNCMFKQFNMPFRKLKFIPIYSTYINSTVVNNTSTTNATGITPNSNNTTARNFTVVPDRNSTTGNTTVASNSNNITATNTTIASNSNSTTANTTIASNSNYRTATNTTVISNSTEPITTPTTTGDNSTFPDARMSTVLPTANSTTAVPTNATTTSKTPETHIENIQMTTKTSHL